MLRESTLSEHSKYGGSTHGKAAEKNQGKLAQLPTPQMSSARGTARKQTAKKH